jgi:hypothetical protein
MIYLYEKLLPPNLDILEENFLISSIAETYNHFRWDEEDKKLKIYLNRELTVEEKLELNTLISNI